MTSAPSSPPNRNATSARPHPSVFAAVLYVAICLCARVAVCDETYSATATFEVRPRATTNLATVLGILPVATVRGFLPLDKPSVTIKEFRDTSLFDLRVTAATAQGAADSANKLARNIQALLKQRDVEVIIWERALPPRAPTTVK